MAGFYSRIGKGESEREDYMEAEGLILAGGKSLRMGGRHKGSLTYHDETFTRILAGELGKEASCVKVSYGKRIKEDCGDLPAVMDIFPDCGPIGGIHAGLKACKSQFLLAAACDMPLLKIELFCYLIDKLRKEETASVTYDGAVPVTEGRLHPLAAVYRRSAADVLEEQIRKGNYRLRDALECMHILYVDVSGTGNAARDESFSQMLRNINIWEEYERLVKDE